MSAWKGRALCGMLAVCLLFFQPVCTFAAEPEATPSQASVGYSESDVEEPADPEPENPIEFEPEPENSAESKEPAEQEPEEPGGSLQRQSGDAPASLDVDTDTVSSQAALAEWIEQHKETGGTVSLSEHVTITQDMGIYGINGKIIIDTGCFGLVFDGGMLPIWNVFITGEGVAVPVVDVVRANSGAFYEPSWNSTLLQMNVTATGRDGMGGTALRISAADDKAFGMDSLLWQGALRSYGERAIGLWLDAPMEAWCYKVEVSGENSIAVYAPNGADLFYCKLTAEGDGANAAAGNDLSLDSCVASPMPTGMQSINRRAMEESFSRLYLPLEQNGSLLGAIKMLNTPNVFLIDEGGDVISRPFPVYWDEAYYDIDTGILGTTIVSGTVDRDLYGLGIFDDVPITITVEVRDPALPCIRQIAVQELEGKRYAVLNFWQEYDPAEESVILWRSDDAGETWQDATHASDILWNGSSVKFTYDTLEHSVWFQLEVTGAGESNIAVLDERDGVFIGGNGGDRTGTDRGGVNPPSGGGNSGGDGGNGTGGGGQVGSGNSNGSLPGAGEESDDADEEQPYSGNVDTPENGEAANDNNTNAAEDGSVAASDESNVPTDTPPLKLVTKSITTGNEMAAAFAQEPPAQEKPEASKAQPTGAEPETITAPVKEEEVPAIEEAAVSSSPEQSAPEPGFSAKALTIFFVSMAVLCSGVLLTLRFGRNGRWRREKP